MTGGVTPHETIDYEHLTNFCPRIYPFSIMPQVTVSWAWPKNIHVWG